MTEINYCRIAVYDIDRNLLGYKKDTFWTLTKKPEYAKLHPIKDCGLEGHLIKNLLDLANDRGGSIKPIFGETDIPVEGYRIRVERNSAKRDMDKVIAEFRVINSRGRYTAVPCRD